MVVGDSAAVAGAQCACGAMSRPENSPQDEEPITAGGKRASAQQVRGVWRVVTTACGKERPPALTYRPTSTTHMLRCVNMFVCPSVHFSACMHAQASSLRGVSQQCRFG